MGWLWSSTTTAAASTPEVPAASSAQTPSQRPAAPAQQRSPARTREEIEEAELQSILQEFEADARPSSTKYNRVPRESSAASESHSTSSNEPISEQLLPTTMSCRDAFDAAFYCNSMGGQFNNLYRYGSVGSCSESWSDFWFCMRTRSFGAREKQEAIRARYREKEKTKYGRGEFGKSSEDVWKSRDKKLEWGEAFKTPFPEFKGTDEEWNQMEREQRAKFASATKS